MHILDFNVYIYVGAIVGIACEIRKKIMGQEKDLRKEER